MTTRDHVIRLHADGWKDEAIAAELGVTRSAVLYHRQRAGLPSHYKELARRRRAAVAAMNQAGASDMEIARALGMWIGGAKHHRVSAGLAANYRGRPPRLASSPDLCLELAAAAGCHP